MPTLTVTKTYQDSPVIPLTEADLDNMKNSIETFVNTTKLDDDNIQNAGISEVKLASSVVDNATLEQDSSTKKLRVKDLGVTTAKINTAAVTQAKLAARTVTSNGSDPGAGGVSTTASSGAATSTSDTFADVTNLSATITTTGRPVMLMLVPFSAAAAASIEGEETASNTSVKAAVRIKFKRDSTDIALYKVLDLTYTSTASTQATLSAIPSLFYLDTPAAGTYVYKAQLATDTSPSNYQAEVNNCKLIAYEI